VSTIGLARAGGGRETVDSVGRLVVRSDCKVRQVLWMFAESGELGDWQVEGGGERIFRSA